MITFIVIFAISLFFAKLISYLLNKANVDLLKNKWVALILTILYIPLDYYLLIFITFGASLIAEGYFNGLGQQGAILIIRNIVICSLLCAPAFYKMMRHKNIH
ncbi:hypothetical protein OFY73_003377 [Salmonella enterica]|nr:hypothetical protein [Salmonella enterica]EKP2122927.1 hypothetical protein [Salmonella enterica]EKP2132604.1 hypothetical protein [Salmonella enterica]EKP2155801.1 hypothetical protein [Salmonella enterica]